MRREAWPVALLLTLALACGGSPESPGESSKGASSAAAKSKPTKAAEPSVDIVEENEVVEYAYEPEGRRDPFRSFVLEEARERREGRGPLEQFELSQLKVVAVVWQANRPRALIQDPSGRGYVVAEGTSMGKNAGRVIRIHDGGLVVKETYVDYLGEPTRKDIELRVRPRHGG